MAPKCKDRSTGSRIGLLPRSSPGRRIPVRSTVSHHQWTGRKGCIDGTDPLPERNWRDRRIPARASRLSFVRPGCSYVRNGWLEAEGGKGDFKNKFRQKRESLVTMD